jgi:hypothetical protein
MTERSTFMGALKLIVYPLGLAIAGLMIVALFGMAVFGVQSADWAEWQNELVGTVGVIVGLGGGVFGLWLAIRSEERVVR